MDVKAFWETEKALQANKRDVILKQLEMQEIAKHVKPGMRVLDVGCGDGETLIYLAERFEIEAVGIDTSATMINAAINNMRFRIRSGEPMGGGVSGFVRESVFSIPEYVPPFDLIYSERSLINLPDWLTQQQAIRNILGLLKPGGEYLMAEHSQDGLDRLNEWRAMVGLDAIPVPSHNRYLREFEVAAFAGQLYVERGIDADRWPIYFASTYYICSRVANAAMAQAEGREPEYDALVNQLALKLPSIGNIGHGAMWVWRKPE